MPSPSSSSTTSSDKRPSQDTTTTSNSSSSSVSDHLTPTGLSYAMAIFILGASAGMTMYTRRTGSMLSRMEEYTANQLKRNPPKYGPPTREEFEKMKYRW